MASLSLPIIGYHRSALSQKFGIPRQPNLVRLHSCIEMQMPYAAPEAFVGIEAFSHLWVTWHFHQNSGSDKTSSEKAGADKKNFRTQVRPPRLGGNEKLGVFATRSMYRPSELGMSVVALERVVVHQGRVRLYISGADMVDGTPIVDIKPYVAYSDALPEAKSGYATTAPTKKEVVVSAQAQADWAQLLQDSSQYRGNLSMNEAKRHAQDAQEKIDGQALSVYGLAEADLAVISELVAYDPRPAYRQHQLDRVFVMRYKSVDVAFFMQADGALCIESMVRC